MRALILMSVLLAGCGPDPELEEKLQEGRRALEMCVQTVGIPSNPDPMNGVVATTRYPDVWFVDYRDHDGVKHSCEIQNWHRDLGKPTTISVKIL